MKFSLLILVTILLVSCASQAPEPTMIPTIASTNTSIPSSTPTQTETPTKTPTYTPSPTNTKGPTITPNPNLIAKDFIYYYKDNFDFYKKKMEPSLDIELLKFEFQYDENGELNLHLETKSGKLLLKDDWPLNYSLGLLCNMLDEEKYRIPSDIYSVDFLFKDNDLVVYKTASLSWKVLRQYIGEDITYYDLYSAIVYE